MINPINPGSITSLSNQAKLNKELIEKRKQSLLNPVVEPIVKCGLDNPCNFGNHNEKFNKNVLNKLK